MPDTHVRIMHKPGLSALAKQSVVRALSSVEPDVLSEDHGLQVGEEDAVNMRFGPSSIQVVDGAETPQLNLQPHGGGVAVTGDSTLDGQMDVNGHLNVASITSTLMHPTVINKDGGSSSTFTGSLWKTSSGNIEELSYVFTAPPSGGVMFFVNAKLEVGNGGQRAFVAHELYEGTSDAGTPVISFATSRAVEIGTTNPSTGSWAHDWDSLTPGAEYFIRLGYKMTDDVTTGTVWGRNLVVWPKI